ncbi:MAG: transposase [Acidimicrobiia bacterium]
MPRPPRSEYPGAWHHVMNRGACRQDVFLDRWDRRAFLAELAETVERHEIEVHSYVLMGNHYHLLVRTPDPSLGQAMQYLAGRYTQRFNTKHGRDGALFRGRYKAIVIESDRYLLGCSRYIHRNPLEIGAQSPGDYRWSSYPAYLRDHKPPEWLHTNFLTRMAGSAEQYEALVESPLDTPTDEILRRSRLPTKLSGSADAA